MKLTVGSKLEDLTAQLNLLTAMVIGLDRYTQAIEAILIQRNLLTKAELDAERTRILGELKEAAREA